MTTYTQEELNNIVREARSLYESYRRKNPEDTNALVKTVDWLDSQFNNEFNNQQRFEAYCRLMDMEGVY